MLVDRLKERSDHLHGRWVAEAMATYAPRTVEAWTRETDRFANPVGHGLRDGTRRVLDRLLEGADAPTLADGLDEIVRMRAVQQLPPSRALAFVSRLKDVLREEAGDEPGAELAELERRIDELVLEAFDLYTGYRERLFELRMNELKRTIPWSVARSSRTARGNVTHDAAAPADPVAGGIP